MSKKLTDRQLAVIRLMADGLTDEQIATERGISESTVRDHISEAIKKLGAPDRTQAVISAAHQGLISVDDPMGPVRLLGRIERSLSRVIDIVRRRTALTEDQKVFLSAVDEVLYAHDDEDKIKARREMSKALDPLLEKTSMDPEEVWRRPKRDLVEMIADYIMHSRGKSRVDKHLP